MKKALSIMVIMVLLLTTAVGCGGQQDNSSDTPKSAGDGEKIIIKLATNDPESRSTCQSYFKFKEYVEEQSNGQMIVEVYPNGQLGGDRQTIEATMLGTIQLVAPATAVLANWDPKFTVCELPFLFKDKEASYRATDGELGDMLNELLEPLGLKGLGFSDNSLRHITNNVRPINEPDDLEGIKIRVMENPIYIDMFKLFGANPTPMSFGELYTALQQKTVDGQENGCSLIYDSKFNEVQEYLSLTGHVYSLMMNVMNLDFYNSLTPEFQQIIDEGAKKYLVDYQRELESEAEATYLEKLKEEGMVINEITPENQKKFMDAVQPLYEKYEEQVGKDLIEAALRAND
ncbi:MAG TPA: DctP family TRAP transporter solute-binding subunit [Firmicutes bacterium]|nr:DctP family TRAP transporter solute-binding subunit [Bacillota bacterium]